MTSTTHNLHARAFRSGDGNFCAKGPKNRSDDRACRRRHVERTRAGTTAPPAERAASLDRRGRVLAASADADSIIPVPTAIVGATEAANSLCGALGDCDDKDRRALAEKLGQRRA